MIQFICRACRTLHEIPDAQGGSVQECYLCGASIQTPRPGVLVSSAKELVTPRSLGAAAKRRAVTPWHADCA